MNTKQIAFPALDLTREFPRSPRETFAGYVLAARCLDKCRAVIAGTNGEYHFNCPLDQMWLGFAGINAEEFKAYVASGASDVEVAAWIELHATLRPRADIVKWNNKLRDTRLSDLPDEIQVYMEEYIPQFVPKNRPVYQWFDVYDIEEKRL